MEPDIAPLAKRLAEENNVTWQQLNGSGANGKIVERDVLEYLARVMAGEEAINSTPEPVPEGMEAWPEEDMQGFAVQQAAAVSTMVQDHPQEDLLDTDLDDLLDVSDDAFLADFSDDADSLDASLSGVSEASDEDIFLFDDDLSDSLAEEDDFSSDLMAEAELASEEAVDAAFVEAEFDLEAEPATQDDFSLQANQESDDDDNLMFADDDSAEFTVEAFSDNKISSDLFATDFDDNLDLEEDIASLFNDDSADDAEKALDFVSDDSFGTDALADLLPDDVFSDDFNLAVDADSEFEGLEDSFVDLSEDLEADELELSSGFKAEAESSAFTDVSEDASADMFLDDASEEMDDLFDTDLLSEDLTVEDDLVDDLLDDSLSVDSEVDTLFQEADEELFVAGEVNDSDLDDTLFAESDNDLAEVNTMAAEEATEDLEAVQEAVADDLFDDDFIDAVDLSADEVVELAAVEESPEEVSVAEAIVEETAASEPELEILNVESEALVTEDVFAEDTSSEDLVAEEPELEAADVASDALLTEDELSEDVVNEPAVVDAATEEANLESNDIAEEVELEPLPVIAAPVSQESLAVAAPSVVIRRYIDVSSLDQVRAVVAKELKQENLRYDAFLLRAAAKVFGEKVAVLSIDDEGFSAKQGNALSGGLRNTVTALENAEVLADLSQLDLVVVDISSYGLDEIVLNAGVAVLSLGRTTVDEAQAKQMTSLALSGDISVAKAAKQLAELAELLSQPLGLIV